jgi:hypothetical protein
LSRFEVVCGGVPEHAAAVTARIERMATSVLPTPEPDATGGPK